MDPLHLRPTDRVRRRRPPRDAGPARVGTTASSGGITAPAGQEAKSSRGDRAVLNLADGYRTSAYLSPASATLAPQANVFLMYCIRLSQARSYRDASRRPGGKRLWVSFASEEHGVERGPDGGSLLFTGGASAHPTAVCQPSCHRADRAAFGEPTRLPLP